MGIVDSTLEFKEFLKCNSKKRNSSPKPIRYLCVYKYIYIYVCRYIVIEISIHMLLRMPSKPTQMHLHIIRENKGKSLPTLRLHVQRVAEIKHSNKNSTHIGEDVDI